MFSGNKVFFFSIFFFLTSFFFQISAQKSIEDQNREKLSSESSNSNISTDETSEKTADQFFKYRDWHFSFIEPLATEAGKKGFTCTSDEILVQQKAFKARFPGVPVNEREIRNEILARKYANSINGNGLQIASIQSVYDSIKLDYAGENVPALSEIKPLLEMRVILNQRPVQETVKKINRQFELERNQKNIENSETWPAESLFIDPADVACIASHKDSSTCILTTYQYNSYVKHYEIWKKIPLHTAKSQIIECILKDIYIANEAHRTGFTSTDIAIFEKDAWIKGGIRNRKLNKIGRPVLNPDQLWDAYYLYYDALFRERFFPFYSIIGTSDSNYIDSISRLIKKWVSNPAETIHDKKDKNQSDSLNRLPWSYSGDQVLSEDLRQKVDSLRVGMISEVIRTRYGFFVVRFDSFNLRNEISFEEAKEDLIFLATKQKWQNLDSILTEQAYSIFKKSSSLNRSLDTLSLLAYLYPGNSTDRIPSKRDKEKCIQVSSDLLPIDIRSDLLHHHNRSQKKNNVIGPISSRYGTWYFELKGIKPGKNNVLFSKVKKYLIDSLIVNLIENSKKNLSEKPDSILDNIAFSKSYAPRFFGLIDDSLKENTTDSRTIKERVEQNRQKGEQELQEWLNKLKIYSVSSATYDNIGFTEK